MRKKLSKKTWKNIGLGCLAGVLGLGAVMGVGALLNKEEETTKTINPTYAVGGLNEEGRYLETEGSIYTKDAFECQGIDVALAFDNNVSYRIFFYDEDTDFISATEKQTNNYDETTTPFNAMYARIVVTPNDDEKISIFEKNGYAKQLSISVNKDQTHYEMTENLWVDSATMTTDNFYGISAGCSASNVSTTTAAQFKSSELIDVAGYDKLVIVANFDKVSGVNFHKWNANKTLIEYKPLSLTSENVQMTIDGKVATYIFDLDNSVSYVSISNKVITNVGASNAVVEIFGLSK